MEIGSGGNIGVWQIKWVKSSFVPPKLSGFDFEQLITHSGEGKKRPKVGYRLRNHNPETTFKRFSAKFEQTLLILDAPHHMIFKFTLLTASAKV